jgi:hypothetical protein
MLASGLVHEPLARQRPPEQQPSLHALPAQQMSPRPPQRAQTLVVPEVTHALPALQRAAGSDDEQQISPTLPHEVQVLPLQRRPS